jgi:DNA polymerase-3 subunit gamma/tau
MSLATEYRPENWEQIFGHDAEVRSFANAIAARSMQTYLLSGPRGVGKTTLARIAAHELGCPPENRIDYDAADLTGIDDVRRLSEMIRYKPFGSNGATRALVMDECHMLSKSAWNLLLKPTEEPPPDVYWLFCTTQPDKIPPTILTRSLHLQLRLLHDDELTDLVQGIADSAGIDLAPEVRGLVVREAHGSPRQALTNLEACRGITDRAEAARVLNTVIDTDASFALCKALTTEGTTWRDCMKLLERLEGESAEGLRIQILHYLSKGARNATDDRKATYFRQRIEAFAFPYGMADADAQLLRSLGACIFGP